MQNSTQWCNLYSVESKYNIDVNHSKNRQSIKQSCFALYLLSFVYITSQIDFFITQDYLLIFLVTICLLMVSGVGFFLLFKAAKNSKTNQLVLHDNGLIDFDSQTSLSLHINSRIGWFGCWLILINELKADEQKIKIQRRSTYKKKSKSIKIFIFKDSLTTQDYARLTRKILSNHRQKITD